jgi:hypothetical protein
MDHRSRLVELLDEKFAEESPVVGDSVAPDVYKVSMF